MSASARSDGASTQTLDNDEMPPPMPLSCRPFGSGLPIAARKIGSQPVAFRQVARVKHDGAAGPAAHEHGGK